MTADIAALLGEAEWLTELARRLARDPAEAADAVQETWMAALRSPPDPARPARPWLRRVLVNTLRMRHRSRERRASHEADVSSDLAPAPDEVLERARVERRLAELVLALPEPGRTTVLLRYREGLTAEAIARQQGVPAATVRTRLKASLDRLRNELDGDVERRDWRALFVPVAFIPSWRKVVMAKLATKAGVGVVVVIVLALIVGGLVWSRSRGDGDAERGASTEVGSGGASRTRRVAGGREPGALFAQPGLAARAIAGRVTEGGVGFAGATVHLADAMTRTALAEVASGADGAFAFGVRPAMEYVVVATAPNKTAAVVGVDLRAGAADHVELALASCTTKLVGTVADASGGVVVHARVGRADAPWPAVETDRAGRYELCLPFGYTTIEYSAAGYAGRLLEVDVDRVTRRDVALIPEATVAGMVVDEAGAAVGGAWVTIDPIVGSAGEMKGLRDARVEAFAEADGTFRIDRVPPGRSRVVAYAGGALTQSPVGVVAVAGRVVEGVVVRVEPAGSLSGIVVANGVPVVGAAIGARIGNRDALGPRSGSARPVLARSQGDGRFAIAGLPRGELAITVADHAVIAPRVARIGERDVRVEIAALGSITGRVLRRGEPVADAQVNCDNGINVFTRSGLDGRYTCAELAPGRYQVMAMVGDGTWGVFDKPIAITGGETAEHDLAIAYSADICGRVVDERGRAFATVEVRADDGAGDSASAITDDDGRFCARFLSGGHYDVAAFANGQRLAPGAQVELAKPGGHATVELAVQRPDFEITGLVVDSRGAPVPDAIVRATPTRAGGARFYSSLPATVATTGASGEFRLARMPTGTYAVVASGRDGAEAVVDHVAAGATGLSITLDPAGAVEGKLVGFSQTPTVIGAPMRGPGSAFEADRDGDRFRAAGLSPGVYIFTANTGLGESAAVEVTIKPGATVILELASKGSGVLAVHVFDFSTHAPLVGDRCTALASAGGRIGAMYTEPDSGVRTGADGVFLLDPTPAGEVYVMCGGPAGGGGRFVTLAAHQRLDVDVPIVPGGPPRDLGIDFDSGNARIASLAPGGAGARAGLQPGDRILTVDGADVTLLSPPNILRLMDRHPDTAVALAISRGDQRLPITFISPL